MAVILNDVKCNTSLNVYLSTKKCLDLILGQSFFYKT